MLRKIAKLLRVPPRAPLWAPVNPARALTDRQYRDFVCQTGPYAPKRGR